MEAGNNYVLTLDSETHLSYVAQGGYAFITDSTLALRQVAETCDLAILQEQFWPLMYAMGTHNNSAYRPVISQV